MAAGQVVLEHRVAGIAAGVRRVHRVPVAVWPTEEPVVDLGEFLWVVIKAGLADLAIDEVHRPPVQSGGALVGPVEIRVEHRRVPHDIKDDRVAVAVAVAVSVERVEDVAGLDVEPTEVTGSARARHDADARRIAGISPVR